MPQTEAGLGGNLPQTADGVLDAVFTHPLWLVLGLFVLALIPLVILLKQNRLGKISTVFRRSGLLALPCIVLGSLALLALAPAGQSSYAAGAPAVDSVDNVTIDITQGETSGSTSFNFSVSGYTDGYDLLVQADAALAAGVTLAIDGAAVSDAAPALVHEWRQRAVDTTSLVLTVVVPVDAPAVNGYVQLLLTYTAQPKYLTFQDYFASDNTSEQFTSAYCDSKLAIYGQQSQLPSTVNVVDTRNDQSYRMRKLPYPNSSNGGIYAQGGRCFMIDDLKIANYNATAADSDGTMFIPAAATTGVPVNTTAQVWDPSAACASAVVDAGYKAGTPMYQAASTTGCGYLYNWFAATAGGDTNLADANIATSICPLGLKLPWNTAVNEFAVLDAAMATAGLPYSSAASHYENWEPLGAASGSLSGDYNYNTGGFFHQGESGYYWTARSALSTDAYNLYYFLNGTRPDVYDWKSYGFSVRCVL